MSKTTEGQRSCLPLLTNGESYSPIMAGQTGGAMVEPVNPSLDVSGSVVYPMGRAPSYFLMDVANPKGYKGAFVQLFAPDVTAITAFGVYVNGPFVGWSFAPVAAIAAIVNFPAIVVHPGLDAALNTAETLYLNACFPENARIACLVDTSLSPGDITVTCSVKLIP